MWFYKIDGVLDLSLIHISYHSSRRCVTPEALRRLVFSQDSICPF